LEGVGRPLLRLLWKIQLERIRALETAVVRRGLIVDAGVAGVVVGAVRAHLVVILPGEHVTGAQGIA